MMNKLLINSINKKNRKMYCEFSSYRHVSNLVSNRVRGAGNLTWKSRRKHVRAFFIELGTHRTFSDVQSRWVAFTSVHIDG